MSDGFIPFVLSHTLARMQYDTVQKKKLANVKEKQSLYVEYGFCYEYNVQTISISLKMSVHINK